MPPKNKGPGGQSPDKGQSGGRDVKSDGGTNPGKEVAREKPSSTEPTTSGRGAQTRRTSLREATQVGAGGGGGFREGVMVGESPLFTSTSDQGSREEEAREGTSVSFLSKEEGTLGGRVLGDVSGGEGSLISTTKVGANTGMVTMVSSDVGISNMKIKEKEITGGVISNGSVEVAVVEKISEGVSGDAGGASVSTAVGSELSVVVPDRDRVSTEIALATVLYKKPVVDEGGKGERGGTTSFSIPLSHVGSTSGGGDAGPLANVSLNWSNRVPMENLKLPKEEPMAPSVKTSCVPDTERMDVLLKRTLLRLCSEWKTVAEVIQSQRLSKTSSYCDWGETMQVFQKQWSQFWGLLEKYNHPMFEIFCEVGGEDLATVSSFWGRVAGFRRNFQLLDVTLLFEVYVGVRSLLGKMCDYWDCTHDEAYVESWQLLFQRHEEESREAVSCEEEGPSLVAESMSINGEEVSALLQLNDTRECPAVNLISSATANELGLAVNELGMVKVTVSLSPSRHYAEGLCAPTTPVRRKLDCRVVEDVGEEVAWEGDHDISFLLYCLEGRLEEIGLLPGEVTRTRATVTKGKETGGVSRSGIKVEGGGGLLMFFLPP